MYAVDDLSDAIDATREFLTPLRIGFVLKLALIVFFVSSLGMTGPGIPMGDIGMYSEDPTQTQEWAEFEEEFEAETGEEFPLEELIAGLVIIGLIFMGIWLVYALIKAIMEFVFIESLRSDEIHFRRYFKENLGRGLRLFVFRVGVILASIALVGGPLYYVATTGGGLDQASGSTLGAFVAYGFVVTLVYSAVLRFTSEFVAPVMLFEERGVLSAWSRFWSTFKANWTEYVVYLVIAWILLLVITITAWAVIAITSFVLAIPFMILLFILVAVLAELGAIGGILLFLFVFLGFLLFLLVLSLVWAPITAYFQYYALLLLGDTDGELDLIPDQRALIRGDVAGTAAGGSATGHATDSQWDETADIPDDADEDEFGDDDDDDPWSASDSSGGADGEDEFEWYDSGDSDDESGLDGDAERDDADPGTGSDGVGGGFDEGETDAEDPEESDADDSDNAADADNNDADDSDGDLDDRGW
ncbi:hypothetical protein [Halostagnicola sp. A-GB9-2]|uniref:DUF7544 domain-containing protein n=1 Tax=Halostagnicola sp. A-GB9-2 TaxID=3048066 RepID=UPI0024BFA36A|nr:hypothetical protein [Halostagnicola sp. A-GB9-2]MDJ1430628.1 hypothetical protein [Halostagnicola sp. A-GB9-2]